MLRMLVYDALPYHRPSGCGSFSQTLVDPYRWICIPRLISILDANAGQDLTSDGVGRAQTVPNAYKSG